MPPGEPFNPQRIMRRVLLALVPAMLVHTFWFGFGLLINILIASAGALLAEALTLKLRGQRIEGLLTDGGMFITPTLLAFAVPTLAPWWLVASGAAFAMLIAKHAYGGRQLFNPAMVGYAALLVSFPSYMAHTLAPDGLAAHELSFVETLQTVFSGAPAEPWDTITSASPLTALRNGLILRNTMGEIEAQSLFGHFAGAGYEWVALAALAGGAFLLITRTIQWHIPLSMLGAVFFCAFAMHAVDPGRYAGPMLHVFGGASMLGAFFIATDPSTAPGTTRGRMFYGAGIGVCTYTIRTFGGYPDGVAFAVLLMNAAAPLIDRYARKS